MIFKQVTPLDDAHPSAEGQPDSDFIQSLRPIPNQDFEFETP